MPSTPLTDSSIGVATGRAMKRGVAPGFCARTTTDGGTTSGYSEIGMARSASRPARKISVDKTPAKIGRSMKKREIFMAIPAAKMLDWKQERVIEPRLVARCLGVVLGQHRHELGFVWCSGALALLAVVFVLVVGV